MSAVPRTSSKPSTPSTPSTTQSNLKVVKLTPPTFQNVTFTQTGDVQAQKGHIKRTYVCLRPNHKALPRIEAETIQDQTIIHNYGHGGSGWTLLFGTVEKSIKEFTTVAAQKLLPLDTKIVIVGAGCIGLTTAIYLHEKGYKNIEVVAEKLNDIPSYNAGGLFGIVSLNLESEVAQRECEYLILQTYRRYADIANDKDAIFNNGVQKVWSYTGNEANVGPMFTNMGLDLLINYGVIPKGEEVLVDFGKNKFKMIRYETFYVYPTAFMADLHKQIKERGIKIQQGKVNNFSDVKASIVFNCTGLGARELAKDPEMHPVAGHMIELQGQPDIKETNYIIKTKFAMTPVTTPEEVAKLPTLYYMPKAEGVVGGTFVKNDNGDNVEANAKEYRGLIERSRALFGYTPKPAL